MIYFRSWQHLVYWVVHWLSNQFTLAIPVMLLSFHLFMTSKPLNSHGVKSVSLRIQPECGKIRTRKNSVFGHFSRREWISKVPHGLAMFFILPYLSMIGFCIPVDIWFYILYHAVVSVFANFNIKFVFTFLCNLIGESRLRSFQFLSFL